MWLVQSVRCFVTLSVTTISCTPASHHTETTIYMHYKWVKKIVLDES